MIQEQSKTYEEEACKLFRWMILLILLMMCIKKPPQNTTQNTTHMATQLANRAQEICVICTDPINTEKNNVITPCKHQFCMTCFLKHMFTANTCPLCRREIYKKARRTTRRPTNSTN